jgi:adenylate cyclase
VKPLFLVDRGFEPGIGGAGMTTVGLACGSCGIELRDDAKFCDGCGAPIAPVSKPAEYKQVTVLFADVVRSMGIAAALDMERLREIMTELVERSAAVVRRYGGTVEFNGDGVMAIFGAPMSLEDHAFRACAAALDIQEEAHELAAEVQRRDGLALQVRVGLNSGRVIAGDIGSGLLGYSAIGENVGMGQRMESVAPPGGVMLSESTARLVEAAALLGEPEMVRIKGASTPVGARRLLAMTPVAGRLGRQRSTLVGRDGELNTLAGLLEQSSAGNGRVVRLVGPPGIGKSRLVFETTAIAAEGAVDVCMTQCESHTSDIPFHVATRLLRDVFSVGGLEPDAARASIRARLHQADSDDLLLLDDLLGISDSGVPLPVIDPGTRTRRLTSLLIQAAVSRTTPAIFVIEDAHWIDQISEEMFAEFALVVPRTHILAVVTYRPDYHGALDRLPSSYRISLTPLEDSASTELVAELLGPDPSVHEFVKQVAERAAGNPFFAEEIVRDLAERGVLGGEPGAYVSQHDPTDLRVPASLQAAIASRIDRLGATAKRTLNAAAVIGLRFESDLLSGIADDVDLAKLVEADLIDQVRFTQGDEYAFRHPLIRTVAYESQLLSDRSRFHRSLAKAIEQRDPDSCDANAALIAGHFEAAGDLRAAFEWHMRAGAWAQSRDVRAVYKSWQRARDVADRLSPDEPDRSAMRIAPRMLMCGNSWRAGLSVDETGFEELRELCNSAGDHLSVARGMAGMLITLLLHNKFREAADVASESIKLIHTCVEPALALDVMGAASNAKFQAGEAVEGLRLAQMAIDASGGNSTRPGAILKVPVALALAFRALNRLCLGVPGFRDDLDDAVAIARQAGDTSNYASSLLWKYGFPILNGAVLPDQSAIQETAELLEKAKRFGDDYAADRARLIRGLILVRQPGQQATGLKLLNSFRETCLGDDRSMWWRRFVDTDAATEKARTGEFDTAIALARDAVDFRFSSGDMTTRGPAVTVLVESLLKRGVDGDIAEAAEAIDRLAAVPIDPGFVLHELPLLRLRALLARAHGDEAIYRDFADRYRIMANDLGFEGHIAIAEAML